MYIRLSNRYISTQAPGDARLAGQTFLTNHCPSDNDEVKFDDLIEKVSKVAHEVRSRLAGMEEPVQALLTAACAGEHVFLVSPPGTAKSTLARLFAEAVGGQSFRIVLNPATGMEDLFGPIDALEFQRGRWVRRWSGLAVANVAVLDEFFKASPQVVNMLLDALEERMISTPEGDVQIPLVTAIAASNEVPSQRDYAAAWDRLTVRLSIPPLRDEDAFRALLAAEGIRVPIPAIVSADEIRLLAGMNDLLALEEARNNAEIVEAILHIKKHLDDNGIFVSNRRWVKSLRVARANATLAGRERITVKDLSVLRWTLWSRPEDEADIREFILGLTDPLAGQIIKLELALTELREQLQKASRNDEKLDIAAQARRLKKELKGIADHGEYRNRIEAIAAGADEIINAVIDSI